MGNNKKTDRNSRRRFLSLLIPAGKEAVNPEMIKMLTAEGKLVEVNKDVFDKAVNKKKATNKEIFQWMKNPSKEND